MGLLERLISLTKEDKIWWNSRPTPGGFTSVFTCVDGFEVAITNFHNKRDLSRNEVERTMTITSPHGVSVDINACLTDIQELVSLISEKTITDFIEKLTAL